MTLVLPFSALTLADVPRVGGKNASLGEMVRTLVPRGVCVPDGFATTAEAFRAFLACDGLRERIVALLAGLDINDTDALARTGAAVRDAILAAPLPEDLVRAVLDAYQALSAGVEGGTDVAVRSSATAEDLPDASFAGQQETFLNVRGERALLDAVHRCIASLYTDRAISYRVDKGFAHDAVALSVGVQRMVRSDLACSGVMFSIDTETGFSDVVLVTGAWGLGETVVQGSVNPDEFVVFKPTLRRSNSQGGALEPILQKTLGSKELKMVYRVGGTRGTRTISTPPTERARFVLTDDEVLTLSRWACVIEDHYSEVRGVHTPMDMEWAKDGRTGELFIVQARPETVQARRSADVLERWVLDGKGEVLMVGRAVGDRIGSGPAREVTDVHHLAEFQDGEVLVADRTDPDWEPIMKKASAIVTRRGGRTCHAAIVSRELGIPAVVGAGEATAKLILGQVITVACDGGDEGRVLEGAVPFHVERTPVGEMKRPRTKIMMNVGNPAEALRLSRLPSDGVGLARLEFIISTWIGVHPKALLAFPTLKPALRAKIAEAARGFEPGPDWFVERLAHGVGTIAAAFFPRPVIVRLSDFKTNEYAHLLGGEAYEPREENPMLGFRGASRYYDPRYRDAFALECRAMLRVRKTMGLTNVTVMVPFCRTPEEGRLVIAEMAKNGLVQGEDGLEVYVMCEIPSNVELAEEFAEVFDGFSIGSNDLTQLILGVDRDSELVAHLWNAVFEVTSRASTAEILPGDDHVAPDGRVMEVLSEHQCQGWLEGYLLTGRHGMFSCYEAFIHIIDSMLNQHAKWLKVTREIPWRRPIPSLNYLLTSHVWRQDHNGFSHQDPGFLDHVVNKKASVIRVYLPPDANTLLSVTDHCLRSMNVVNVIVAGKQPAPQWLTMDEAIVHCKAGVGIWQFASNDGGADPDVVVACCGDVPTLEALAAVELLREHLPKLKVRLVNVVDLMKLQPASEHPHGLSDPAFDAIFTTDRPILFAFHGYPWLIHRLAYRRRNHPNLHVRGYKEEGSTTTPFDMCVRNDLDRFHLVQDVIDRVPSLGVSAADVRAVMDERLAEHHAYIRAHGDDIPAIRDWRWGG